MDPHNLYGLLTDAAQRIGLSIRYEHFTATDLNPKSALCTIKGERVLIMDASIDIRERIFVLTKCLREMDLDGIYLVPALRSLLRPTDQI
jgi:hypothetical protein